MFNTENNNRQFSLIEALVDECATYKKPFL